MSFKVLLCHLPLNFQAQNATAAPQQDPGRYLRADDVGFFDPELDEGGSDSVVNVGKYVFYKDIFAFVDRLEDLAAARGENEIREVLPTCLRGAAHIWHSVELTQIEKEYIRAATLTRICRAMIARFKERGAVLLSSLARL